MSEALAARKFWSKNFTQSSRLLARGEASGEQDYRYMIAERVLSHHPGSVLEFGCNSGRNLAALGECFRGSKGPVLTGADINPGAISLAQQANPGMLFQVLTDEWVPEAKAYDVVFTCSVLDHIPCPEWRLVYDKLAVMAAKALIIVEPIYPWPSDDPAGKVRTTEHDFACPEVPFTYAHDYLGHDRRLKLVSYLPMPGPYDFGRHYFMFERLA